MKLRKMLETFAALRGAGGRPSRLAPHEFIALWQAAPTLKDLRRATGISHNTLCTRAAAYRKKGIPLKRFALRKTHVKDATLRRFAERVVVALEARWPNLHIEGWDTKEAIFIARNALQ